MYEVINRFISGGLIFFFGTDYFVDNKFNFRSGSVCGVGCSMCSLVVSVGGHSESFPPKLSEQASPPSPPG